VATQSERFVRVIRYRWLPGHTAEAQRLAQVLVESAQGQPGCRGIRVLTVLDSGTEGLVVFEWETRAAMEAHASTATIERLAPWAMPFLHWRTDQRYVLVAAYPPPAPARPEAGG
jgi:quinol monooxygenase YgiN